VKDSGLPESHFELCDECSRVQTAKTMYAHMVPASPAAKGVTP